MAKIRKLADVLRQNPAFKPGWSHMEETMPDGTRLVTGVENPRFGKVERIVICRDDGTPLWDQYQIEEGPVNKDGKRALWSGAVIAPFYEDNGLYVGLIDRIRELIIDPKTGEQGKFMSIEFPRGISRPSEKQGETAVRELGEETSKVAKKFYNIGKINPNTAFYVTDGVPVFAAEVDPAIRSHLKPDSNEPILKCNFLPYSEARKKVLNQEVYCGWTLSAFAMLDVLFESLNKIDVRYNPPAARSF